MDTAFIYYKPVTGKSNIGRRSEQSVIANLLDQGENVLIYEPAKTGKKSLLQQTFFNMRISGKQFSTAEVPMLSVRSAEDFLIALGSAVIRSQATTPDEYQNIVGSCLKDTHFVFDPVQYSAHDSVLSLSWELDENDIRSMLCLPWRLAALTGRKIYLILDEFQNITFVDGWEKFLKLFESVLRSGRGDLCNIVFMGSAVNAMKYIFEEKVFFHRQVNHVGISEIEAREITDNVVRGFLTTGKVIDKDLMMSVCKRFRNNIWYINHFASICDHLTKGFITDATLQEALDMLISIHEPRFRELMSDLTGFQISLLRATLDGCKRFSSAEVISKYHLNSSANVRRLKDALCKKEIITFTDNDDPLVLDPLFEYWLRKFYFKMKDE